MDQQTILALLSELYHHNISPEEAAEKLRALPFTDIGFARVDHHRALRKGTPEVIFCQGKSPEQIVAISKVQCEKGETVFGTRASPEALTAVKNTLDKVEINEMARCFWIKSSSWKLAENTKGTIVIATAGTADTPVAEEAKCTVEILGHPVKALYDVGVAGIHRLFACKDELMAASALIAVAGMEGALPSVITGLVSCPVIGVPTSVGYGSHLGGMVPLFAMLNSCASGLSVVNIDNGFGAAYAACMMNKR